MSWFCKDLRNKKCLNACFFNVLKVARNLINKCKNKFFKFDTILASITIIIILFISGEIAYNTMQSDENARKVLSDFFVLKNSLFHQETFDKIALKLMVYDAKVKENPMKFIRLGSSYDCGYVVVLPIISFED